MKKLMEFLKGYAIQLVVGYLKANKKQVVADINAKIDFPFIGEAKEAEFIEGFYEGMVEIIESIKLK